MGLFNRIRVAREEAERERQAKIEEERQRVEEEEELKEFESHKTELAYFENAKHIATKEINEYAERYFADLRKELLNDLDGDTKVKYFKTVSSEKCYKDILATCNGQDIGVWKDEVFIPPIDPCCSVMLRTIGLEYDNLFEFLCKESVERTYALMIWHYNYIEANYDYIVDDIMLFLKKMQERNDKATMEVSELIRTLF